MVQWEGLKHTFSLVSWIILSHKKDGSSGTLNSKVPDIHVEWRRTSMKSQAEDMLEIDKVGGWSRIGGRVILKGVSLLTRRFSVMSVDVIIPVFTIL